jgi:putative colanic acid biosysnthesis UDP-glucose lipid carrier transferase
MHTEFFKLVPKKINASNDNDDLSSFYTKRVKPFIDKGSALFLLTLLAPLFLVVAFLIKLESKGSVFFRQSRIGLRGRTFRIFKFRSMTVSENGSDVLQAQKNDVRVTKIGKFIRKTSIDELPQLFNVLLGDMSLVGPRPHAVNHDIEFTNRIPNYQKRHAVLPGITGLAQVNGYRGPTDTDAQLIGRVESDILYTKNIGLATDVKIIAKTALLVLNDRNAF